MKTGIYRNYSIFCLQISRHFNHKPNTGHLVFEPDVLANGTATPRNSHTFHDRSARSSRRPQDDRREQLAPHPATNRNDAITTSSLIAPPLCRKRIRIERIDREHYRRLERSMRAAPRPPPGAAPADARFRPTDAPPTATKVAPAKRAATAWRASKDPAPRWARRPAGACHSPPSRCLPPPIKLSSSAKAEDLGTVGQSADIALHS